MNKTAPTFKETKLGILSIEMIENIVFDNVILVKSYIFENYKQLEFNLDTVRIIHRMLGENLYLEAGKYRKHNVQLGEFVPIDFYQVPVEIKNLDEDIKTRLLYLKNEKDKKEFLAYVLRKLLWIHPFFDYNGRVTRLFGELFLLKNKMKLTTFQQTDRLDFVKAVKKATSENDFKGIIAMFD